jgi:hypothetical protein
MGAAIGGWWRLAALISMAARLPAQGLMPPPESVVHPETSDLAILEKQEKRKDLPCAVDPVKPTLGFDLKFHAGYDATVPLSELGGGKRDLTMVFSVAPASGAGDAAYFTQRIHVPQLDLDAKGDAMLSGEFDLGEGKYHVSWLMRDGGGRFCASNWDIEAALPPRDKQMPLDIAANRALASDPELFRQEPAISRDGAGRPLNLKLLVNFAPQDPDSAALQSTDLDALLAILRRIARDPRVVKISIVAFNMQEERVIYTRNDASGIDFPALGEALKSLKPGSVPLRVLKQKHGGREFLGDLLRGELRGNPDQPDAVIIAGPKVSIGGTVPKNDLKEIGGVGLPVFYMNYALDPTASPWRDAIGNTVRELKGLEYTIGKPRDVFFVWSEIADRIVKSKFGETPSVADSQSK